MIKIPLVTAVLTILLVGAGSSQIAISADNPQAHALRARARRASRSDTEILWDSWGVPHIFAPTEADAFRAFGWAQMHNDGDLLLQLMAQGRGRGAEFYGARYLPTDRTVRLLGLYDHARASYERLDTEMSRDMAAFAAGINEYAHDHPEKLSAMSKAVLPVGAADVLAANSRVFQELMDSASSKAGGGCSVDFPSEPQAGGSNGWAIGPAHSANGHAMLLANPHLPWNVGELTFFEAQISAPGYKLYGATLLGSPVLSIGFNDLHGWTLTVDPIRTCDTYALSMHGTDEYLFDGVARAFDVQRDVIKIRQADGSLRDEPIELRHSALGPVYEKDGKFYAVRIAGVQVGSDAGAYQEYWDMGRARNLHEFQAALGHMQMPMSNVIYADREGNIEFLYNGLDPVRTSAMARPGILPGDSAALVWDKLYGYEALPKAINPASGFVQNSNSAPWYMTEPFRDPGDYPRNIAPIMWPLLREERGLKMITAHPKLSYGQMGADQFSTHAQLADLVLRDLVQAAKRSSNPLAQQAAGVLETWDGNMDAGSRGAVLFYVWAQQLKHHFFATPFDPQRPTETPNGLKDSDAAVAALVAAAGELRKENVPLDVPWGKVFHLRRGKFDFPGTGGPGQLGIFDVISYHCGKGGLFEADQGDTFMAQVEFGSPLKAKALLTYGNSSDPDSPHYGDQLALFAKKEWREPWRTRGALAGHVEERTVLPAER